MPAKSRAQAKFMYAMQENPKLAAQHGIKPEVAQEFTQGMSKKRWSKLKEKVSKK